jgi:hypothetical protein
LGQAAKNKAPERGSGVRSGVFHIHRMNKHIAHFWPKSKPYGAVKQQIQEQQVCKFDESVNAQRPTKAATVFQRPWR